MVKCKNSLSWIVLLLRNQKFNVHSFYRPSRTVAMCAISLWLRRLNFYQGPMFLFHDVDVGVAGKSLLSQELYFPSTSVSGWNQKSNSHQWKWCVTLSVQGDPVRRMHPLFLLRRLWGPYHFWEDSETQGQRSAKYGLWAKSSLPLDFVNKILWKAAIFSHLWLLSAL